MARKLRVEYPGAIYHVMNRGDRRESVFSGSEQLQARCKRDGRKVRIAQRLRSETTMTVAWIAEPLHMGVLRRM